MQRTRNDTNETTNESLSREGANINIDRRHQRIRSLLHHRTPDKQVDRRGRRGSAEKRARSDEMGQQTSSQDNSSISRDRKRRKSDTDNSTERPSLSFSSVGLPVDKDNDESRKRKRHYRGDASPTLPERRRTRKDRVKSRPIMSNEDTDYTYMNSLLRRAHLEGRFNRMVLNRRRNEDAAGKRVER